MLSSQFQSKKDQLIADLTELRTIVTSGWTKGAFKNSQGVCVLAGIKEVTGGSWYGPADVRTGMLMWAISQALVGDRMDDKTIDALRATIISFNDAHATKEAVIFVLDKAITSVAALLPATPHER